MNNLIYVTLAIKHEGMLSTRIGKCFKRFKDEIKCTNAGLGYIVTVHY